MHKIRGLLACNSRPLQLKVYRQTATPPTLNFLLFYDQNKREDRIETDNSWLMRLATYLFMNVVRYMVCAFNWCFKCSHLLYCRRVCLLSGLIFLSLLEKRPLRIANSDNLPETDWLGLGMYAPGIFQPYLKTLHHLLFSRSYWYVIFFSFICVQIRDDRRRRAKRNKRTQYVISSPSLLDSKQTHA